MWFCISQNSSGIFRSWRVFFAWVCLLCLLSLLFDFVFAWLGLGLPVCYSGFSDLRFWWFGGIYVWVGIGQNSCEICCFCWNSRIWRGFWNLLNLLFWFYFVCFGLGIVVLYISGFDDLVLLVFLGGDLYVCAGMVRIFVEFAAFGGFLCLIRFDGVC